MADLETTDTESRNALKGVAEALGFKWVSFWIGVGTVLAGVHFLIAVARGVAVTHAHLIVIAGMMVPWIVIEIVWSQEKLSEFGGMLEGMVESGSREEALRWYTRRTEATYDRNGMIAVGVLLFLATIAVCLATQFTFWQSDPLLVAYDLALLGIVAFLGGMSQWAFHNISYTISQLPLRAMKVNLYSHKSSDVFYIGSLLLQIWLGGMGLIILVEVGVFTAPVVPALLLQILIGLASLGAIVWFVIVQRNMHRLMVRQKRTTMNRLGELIEAHVEELTRDFREERLRGVRELRAVYEDVSSLPEWPFDSPTMVKFVTASISPLVGLVLSRIWR